MKMNCPHKKDEDFLSIDKYALDLPWLKQAELYRWYAECTADANQRMNEAKDALEVVKASLSLSIRANPHNFGIEKPTEKAVEAAVILDDSYAAALKETHTTRHEYDCLKGVLTALDHKKKALEKLVDLQGRDYFSEPHGDQETKEKIEEQHRDRVTRRGVRGRKRNR